MALVYKAQSLLIVLNHVAALAERLGQGMGNWTRRGQRLIFTNGLSLSVPNLCVCKM